MDGYGNIQFLGESEVAIDRGITGRDALILEAHLAHYFETAVCEGFSQLFEGDALAGSHPALKGCAGDDPGGCGVFPFLHALWIAKNNRRDVEALHLAENIFHILARSGRVECWGALLFHPTEWLFLTFRIGRCDLRGFGANGCDAGKGSVHGVDVNIDYRWSFGLSVLCERDR